MVLVLALVPVGHLMIRTSATSSLIFVIFVMVLLESCGVPVDLWICTFVEDKLARFGPSIHFSP